MWHNHIAMENQAKSATVLARRKTADGRSVKLWSDGQVTWAFSAIRGIGRAIEPWAQEADLKAGWAAIDLVSLCDAAEIPALIKEARKAFRAPFQGRPGFRGGEPGALVEGFLLRRVAAANA